MHICITNFHNYTLFAYKSHITYHTNLQCIKCKKSVLFMVLLDKNGLKFKKSLTQLWGMYYIVFCRKVSAGKATYNRFP